MLYPLGYVIAMSFASPAQARAGVVFPTEFSLRRVPGDLQRRHRRRALLNSRRRDRRRHVAVADRHRRCWPAGLSPDQAGARRQGDLDLVLATMFFSAGIIPNFLLIKSLGLLDSTVVVDHPGPDLRVQHDRDPQLLHGDLPSELIEAARIDGAGEWRIFLRIVLPLSKAGARGDRACSTPSATGTPTSTHCCTSTTRRSGRSRWCCSQYVLAGRRRSPGADVSPDQPHHRGSHPADGGDRPGDRPDPARLPLPPALLHQGRPDRRHQGLRSTADRRKGASCPTDTRPKPAAAPASGGGNCSRGAIVAGGLAAAGATGIDTAQAVPFTHPGMLLRTADLDRIRSAVQAKREPWLSGWNRLITNRHSAATWQPRPVEKIIRGNNGTDPENYGLIMNDMHAAYQNATALADRRRHCPPRHRHQDPQRLVGDPQGDRRLRPRPRWRPASTATRPPTPPSSSAISRASNGPDSRACSATSSIR